MRTPLVLAVAGIAMLLAGCTSTNTPSAAPSSVPSSSATATPPPVATPTQSASPYISDAASKYTVTSDSDTEVTWLSPSKNIACAIVLTGSFATLWGCTVQDHSWTAPSAASGDICYNSGEDCGSGIEAMGDGKLRGRGEYVFESQRAAPGGGGADAPVQTLTYGHSVTAEGVTCVSLETGMTCTNAGSGHSFTLSKSTYTIH